MIPNADGPVGASGDENLRVERIVPDAINRAVVAIISFELLLAVRGRALVDDSVLGSHEIHVWIVWIKVDAHSSGSLGNEGKAFHVAVFGSPGDPLQSHDILTVQTLFDGPLRDSAIPGNGRQLFSIVPSLVDPLQVPNCSRVFELG